MHDTELDGIFLIEEVLEKKGGRYHIKWRGYSTTTWEPASRIADAPVNISFQLSIHIHIHKAVSVSDYRFFF